MIGLSKRDIAQLLILGAIWGSSFMFMRQAAPILGAVLMTEIRVTVAAFLLVIVALGCNRTLQLHEWRDFLLVGFLNIAAPFSLFAFAAKSLPSGYLSVVNATAPIFGALFATLLLHERLSRLRCIGLFLGFAGVAMMMITGPVALNQQTLTALAAGVLASMCYGIAVIRLSMLLKRVPGLVVAATTLCSASFLLAIPTLLVPQIAPTLFSGNTAVQSSPDTIFFALRAAVILGVLCTAIAYVIYYDLVRRVPPTRAIAVTFLVPVFATIWGSFFLNEQFTIEMGLGGAVALVGTYLALGTRTVVTPR